MVTVQELQQKEEELREVERQAQAVAQEQIPQRRYGAGVTKEQQQEVLKRRSEALQVIEQVKNRRAELETIKKEVISQEIQQREAQQEREDYQRGYDRGTEGLGPGYKPSEAQIEGYKAGRNAFERNEARQDFFKGKSTQKATYKDLGDGMYYYEGRIFDKSGQEIFLKSGIGLSPQQAEIRDKLVKAGLLKEQSTATGLGVSPLTDTYLDIKEKVINLKDSFEQSRNFQGDEIVRVSKPSTTDKSNQDFLNYLGELKNNQSPLMNLRSSANYEKRILYISNGVPQTAYFLNNKQVSDREERVLRAKEGKPNIEESPHSSFLKETYNSFFDTSKYAGSEKNFENQFAVGLGQASLRLAEETANFFINLIPKQKYYRNEKKTAKELSIEEANYIKGVGLIPSGDYNEVNQKIDIRNLYKDTSFGKALEDFRNKEISFEANVISKIAVYTPVITYGVVSLGGGLYRSVKSSFTIEETATGYGVVRGAEGLKPLKEFSSDTLRGFNFLNFKNPTPAIKDLQKGINLRKIDTDVLYIEGQVPVIINGKQVYVSRYFQSQEIKAPRFKLNKDYLDTGGIVGLERTSNFINPERNLVIPKNFFAVVGKPYEALEFRQRSNIVRVRKVGGQSDEFNPNLGFNQLNKAEKYTLLKYIERELGYPEVKLLGKESKFVSLKYKGEPTVKRFKSNENYQGYYEVGTEEIYIKEGLKKERLLDVFTHERTHFKRFKSGERPFNLLEGSDYAPTTNKGIKKFYEEYDLLRENLSKRGYDSSFDEEIIAYGSQSSNDLGFKEGGEIRKVLEKSIKKIGAERLSDKEINDIIKGGRKIKVDKPLFEIGIQENDLYQKGGVITRKQYKLNIKTGEVKEFGVPGKKQDIEVFTGRLRQFLETEKVEGFEGVQTFKNVNNPNFRKSGKVTRLRGEVYVTKEPIILSEESTPFFVPSSSMPKTGATEGLLTVQQQNVVPINKPLIKVPQVKVQTQATELTPTQSTYFGQGTYERTEQATLRTPKGFVDTSFTNRVSVKMEIETQKPILGGKIEPFTKEITREISREINKEISKEVSKEITKEISKLSNRQLSRQINKQITKQIQKETPKQGSPTRIPPKTPTETIVRIPNLDLPEYKSGSEGEFGFKPFVIKKGKKVYLRGILPKAKALGIAQDEAIKSLRATFGVEKTKVYVGSDETAFKLNKELFRGFRIKEGQRIKLTDTFIQKRGKRLESPTEIAEIQMARRR